MNRKIIKACNSNMIINTDIYELECGHIYFQPQKVSYTSIVWCNQCDRALCRIPDRLSDIWPLLSVHFNGRENEMK